MQIAIIIISKRFCFEVMGLILFASAARAGEQERWNVVAGECNIQSIMSTDQVVCCEVMNSVTAQFPNKCNRFLRYF